MKQSERQERSRARILQAALEEFGTQDYATVTMERICGQHGISKGLMYHYFGGKEDLFLLCAEDTFQQLAERVMQTSLHDTADATASMERYFLTRETFFRAHPLHRRVFETAMLRPPEHLRAQIEQRRAPLRAANEQFLRSVLIHAPLREGITEEDAAAYFHSIDCVYWKVLERWSGGTTDLDDFEALSHRLLDLLLFGLIQQK